MLALPYRHGGLGIRNPVETADTAYEASVRITQPLTDLIAEQDMNLGRLDHEMVRGIKSEVAAEKERAMWQRERRLQPHWMRKVNAS